MQDFNYELKITAKTEQEANQKMEAVVSILQHLDHATVVKLGKAVKDKNKVSLAKKFL